VEVLTLDVRGDNAGAIALYEQEGFVRHGALPGFVAVGERRWDMVLMARPLQVAWAPEMTDHLVSWLVVRRDDGRVLLQRRAGVRYGSGQWSLPGGHVEDGESLAAGGARELAEEAGLLVDPAALVPIGVSRYVDGAMRGTSFFFRADSWQGEPAAVSESSEVGWFDPAHLPDDALPWLAQSLRTHLLDGVWLADSPGTPQD
jgi:8-oxo-dGTP diphosphatase